MTTKFEIRRAASLIELLVVIAILGVPFALVLGGIQKVRTASLRLHSENNLRQMSMAFHTHLANNNDEMKGLPKTTPYGSRFYPINSVFHALTQILMPRTFPTDRILTSDEIGEFQTPTIAIYLSPADPSLHYNPKLEKRLAKISYGANMTAFDGIIRFPVSLPDGTTSTICFAERYFYTEFTPIEENTLT